MSRTWSVNFRSSKSGGRRDLLVIGLLYLAVSTAAFAQDPRTIVEEAQKRSVSMSQRYEGTLKVIDDNNKVTEKRWTFERIGSHGNSKSLLRFSAPAEVKGVALLVINHPDRSSDQWMWTPALVASVASPSRIGHSVFRNGLQFRRSGRKGHGSV